MNQNATRVLVVGAGFFGLTISRTLAEMGFDVTVLEASPRLGMGASWANQARVHGGYHYPRSLLTGKRSRESLKRFVSDYGSAVDSSVTSVYAIARGFSRVSAEQFEIFCRRVNAPIKQISNTEKGLSWNPRLISRTYLVEEPTFDSDVLLEMTYSRALEVGVQIEFGSRVDSIMEAGGMFEVTYGDSSDTFAAVFEVTYSLLGSLFRPSSVIRDAIKLERAEIALFEPPAGLEATAVTVMDGPFFSFMPFPTRGLHSLTHVRYTPKTSHQALSGKVAVDTTSHDKMRRDAARFFPEIEDARYSHSIFVDKAVLRASENDDSRPILVSKFGSNRLYFTVLGAKIDNIYDAIDYLKSDGDLQRLREKGQR